MANVEIIQPKDTSALKKRQFIFDILFDQIEEQPIYVHPTTTKGGHIKNYIIYYTHENGYYVIDKQNTYIQKLISDIMEKTNEQIDENGKTIIAYGERTAINNWFSKRTLTELTNYIKLFKEELVQRDLIKNPLEFRKFSYYDRDEDFVLLNTEDKTLRIDIESDEIIELDFSPDFLFMSKITTKYESEVNQKDSDFWLQFLEDIMPNQGERRILQHWCSYALVNKFFDWQVSIMLYGPLANNGKSTFMNAFGSLFNNCETATLAEITGKFGTEKLSVADFILADESSAKFEDTSKLKQIFEGGSTNIEGKGSAQYTGMIDSKVLIASNKLSSTLISDSGIARRVEILSTPHSFNKDENNNLGHELEKIKKTILNWAISVIPNMINNVSNFKLGTRERTEGRYQNNETPFSNFVALYCDVEKNLEIRLDELVIAYNTYREKYQARNLNAIQIGRIISKDFENEIYSKRSRSLINPKTSTKLYTGISINDEKMSRDFVTKELPSLKEEW